MEKRFPVLIAECGGYELWAHYDDQAMVWEVTLDENNQDYIGITTDTLREATSHACQWLVDTLAMERGVRP